MQDAGVVVSRPKLTPLQTTVITVSVSHKGKKKLYILEETIRGW